MNEQIQAIIEQVHKEVLEWPAEERKQFWLTGWKGAGLHMYHHSFGRHIRNTYKLWTMPWEPEIEEIDGYMVDVSPYHPDAMSMTIIQKVWEMGRTLAIDPTELHK